MFTTPHHILAGLALILAVISLVWQTHPLLTISVILLAIAEFLP